MDLISTSTLSEFSLPASRRSLPTVTDIVEQVMMSERKGLHQHEQRESDRYPYSQIVVISPFDRTKGKVIGSEITPACRNLSRHGLGFYHSQPLEARHVLVQFLPKSEHPLLLMKLVWCRFIKPGWYDNGGRFVRIATPAA